LTIQCPKCQTKNPSDSKFCKECATPLSSSQKVGFSQTETLLPPREDLTSGTVFAGRYQVIEELGYGGMGRIYKVFDKETNSKVALKLIKPEIAADRNTIERFRNELKVARDISHKHACRMYDLGREADNYFITMEYVQGEDLKSFIRRAKRLDTGTAIYIAKQVCEGLAEAHRVGVVHRDLKPSNIMIDREGDAKIMDFGIARSLRTKGITGPGVVIGTPEYMSPEQVEGKEADERSDIYSLGIIFYEMVTGRVPFEADTALAVGYKHKNDVPVSPKTLNPQVPEDLSGLILKCLEKSPDKRWRTAEELHAELEKIEKGLPTTAIPTPAPKHKTLTSREITIKFTARKLLFPGLAFIALAAAVILAIVFLPHHPPQKKAGPIHKQITFTGRASSPDISADGKFFAYADSINPEEQKVMIQDISSGQTIEVFRGKNCGGLRWSPDGSELSFHAQGADSKAAVFLVPRLGGKVRRMDGMKYAPVWSSNGNQLLHFSWENKQFVFTDKTTGESKSVPLNKSIPQGIEYYDWSPSGRFIVLTTSDAEGKYSLWTVATEGSSQYKIAEDANWLGSPRWSPRGDAVYYLLSVDQTTDIWKISVSPETGKPLKSPSPILEGYQAGDFAMTNDGKRLFYVRGPNISNLWLAAREDSGKSQKAEVKQLTALTMSNFHPSLSPDGKLVAYASVTGSSANIYIMPAEGGPSQQITFMNSWSAGPVWSPDGKEIAFFSNQGGSWKIWKISAAGGQPHQFAKSDGTRLTWAPGQRILYRSSKNKNLRFIDPATEEETPLFKTNPVGNVLWPEYSADGKKVAVLWYKESGKDPAIWIISPDDSSAVLLRKGGAIPTGWSADGKWVYASEMVRGRFDVIAISSENGQSKPWLSVPLSLEMGMAAYPGRSTDGGTHFVFSAMKSQSDIWMVENFDPEIK